MSGAQHVKRNFGPVWDPSSRILILGSFPSVKSREAAFFYGHPQNRFWRVIAEIFGEDIPCSVDEKRKLLLRNHIALWDVIASCEIDGSSDSSIKNAVPNDIGLILNAAPIRRIYVNGKTAARYCQKHLAAGTDIDFVCLPSTSPANAAWSLDRLIEVWSVIKT